MFLKTITFKSLRDPSVSANISKMVIATGNLLAYIEFIIANAKKKKKKNYSLHYRQFVKPRGSQGDQKKRSSYPCQTKDHILA